ncbi:unnamed protein product, partial [Ostreobium quekettii]
TPLALHFGESTIILPFSFEEARNLGKSIQALIKTFAEKQEAERPKRWDMMEYRYKSEGADDAVSLFEVFCNPNAHSSAFDAKLLVTVQAPGGLKMTTEGRLSNVKADLAGYLQQHKP